MHAIPGTYHNGQITLDEKADWPDGGRVMVEPAPVSEEFQRLANQWREETTCLSIAKRIKRMAEHGALQKHFRQEAILITIELLRHFRGFL